MSQTQQPSVEVQSTGTRIIPTHKTCQRERMLDRQGRAIHCKAKGYAQFTLGVPLCRKHFLELLEVINFQMGRSFARKGDPNDND